MNILQLHRMFTVFRFINYRSGLMAMSTTAAVSTTVSAVVTAIVATTSATASAFAGHHFNHFLNFFVCSRTALGNLATKVKSSPANGWFISITTVSAFTSTTLPFRRWPSEFIKGMMFPG